MSLFEDRNFYRRTMMVAMPIMLQNGITNLVGMLDNVMVGRIGTDSMSGVSIVNQLLFIFYLCIFGGLAGIGIFTAQYYGSGDEKGVRYTFRLQVMTALVLTAAGTAVLWLFGERLIGLYLHSDSGIGNAEMTLHYAKEYLLIMFAGLLPFALGQVYSSTLRSTGETVIPMYAGLAAVFINLAGNYILIYGKLGAPAMGASGAALATVISRFAELLFVAVWTHKNAARFTFIRGAYRRLFHVPPAIAGRIIVKALPLLFNEALWSGGMAMVAQCYSVRGLSVVAATNIANSISNVFNVSFIAMGSAIAIILGQKLGAGQISEARDQAGKLTLFSVEICAVAGLLLFVTSFFFPMIYNTSDEIRAMAGGLIRITAVFMPLYAFTNAAYFTIRSGGRTVITFLFDSCFVWVCSVPLAFFLAHYTSLPILPMFAIVQSAELVKCLIGWRMMAGGSWAQNLTQ